MTVNDLARRVGVPAHVVRYYTQCGLLRPIRNSRNAYRDYGETDLRRLRFICSLKPIGFTLTEIGTILSAVDDEAASFTEIREILRLRAEQYQKELASAQRLQQRLMELIGQGDEPADDVPAHVKLKKLIDAVVHDDDLARVNRD